MVLWGMKYHRYDLFQIHPSTTRLNSTILQFRLFLFYFDYVARRGSKIINLKYYILIPTPQHQTHHKIYTFYSKTAPKSVRVLFFFCLKASMFICSIRCCTITCKHYSTKRFRIISEFWLFKMQLHSDMSTKQLVTSENLVTIKPRR